MMDNNGVNGLYEQYFSVTDCRTDSSQYPDLALTDDNEVYLCWQCCCNKHDVIKAASVAGGGILEPVSISFGGQSLHPRIHWFSGTMWVIWCEYVNKSWSLIMRSFLNGKPGEPIVISQSSGIFYPSVSSNDSHMSIAWCEMDEDDSRIMLASFDGKIIAKKQQVSTSAQSYRPSICYGDNGELYIAYDMHSGDHYDIAARVMINCELSNPIIVSKSVNWAARPVIAKTSKEVVLAWYEVAAKSMMCYNIAALVWNDGRLDAGEVKQIGQYASWANYLDVASNGDKLVACHTKGNRMAVIRIRKPDGSWSEVVPLVQSNERYYTHHPRILMDNNDNIYIVYHTANSNGHHDRHAEVIFGMIRYGNLSANESEEVGSSISKFTRPIEAKKSLDRHDGNIVREWLDKNGYHDLVLKFGDIHGQSAMSDGSGEMDHYFNYARFGTPKMDFTALTDHESFPDIITESEWEFMRTAANKFNKDGEFATLLAYEWTSNEYRHDFGHKNVYYRTGDGEIYRATDEGGLTPDRLFASLRKHDAICIPHHPAGVWTGPCSASTDWNFHDPDVQRIVEVFSRHAPYEKYGDVSCYTKNQKSEEGKFVQDALAKGYRMGLIAGSDSHQLEHGVEGGILGAFMPALTRENLFDALYNRFVYATTGAQILVSFKINNEFMGSELSVTTGEKVTLEISVLGTNTLESVEIVKNNEVMECRQPASAACDFIVEDSSVISGDYYYVRVNQMDMHQAWSSPIWVDFR